jgi:hypothetical protein
VTAEPDSCPRCAELEARLQFRPCGYGGPGSARVAVTLPGGRTQEGWLCRPHAVLLAASGRFGVHLVVGFGGQTGPCQWLVPCEEAMAADGAVPAEDLEEAIPVER